jgi:hypothetical protein
VKTFRNLSAADARLIKRIAKAHDERDQLATLIEKCCPETQSYVRSLHSDPYRSGIWRTTVALHAINVLVDGHGIEGLGEPRGGDYAPPYEYINMGDTYAATLVYKRDTDTLSIGSWGDIAESLPSQEEQW